jgi:hypothetical protein
LDTSRVTTRAVLTTGDEHHDNDHQDQDGRND